MDRRIIEKVLLKRKTQRKLVKLLPGILEKATIAHIGFKKNQTLQVLEV